MAETNRIMSVGEAEKFILKLLEEKGGLTTAQIMKESKQRSLKCPESTGSFLARMRFEGKISGRLLLFEKNWIWTLPS